MAEREVDPLVSHALRLMMTRTRESQEQLRLLLEDEIRKRTGKNGPRLPYPIEIPPDCKESNSRQKGVENRTASFLIEDSSKDLLINEASQGDSETEINMESLEEDLACVVCRSMDVAPGNRLIECSGCHSLYHQECHRPPVSEDDMEDTRSVWYCTSCTKTMSRPVPKPSAPSKPTNKEPVTSVGKESVLRAKHQTLVFKRTEKPFQMPSGSLTSRSSSQSPGSPQHSSKQAGRKSNLLSSFMQGSKSFGGSTSSGTSATKQSGSSTAAAASSASSIPSPPSSSHSATAASSKSSMVPKINIISIKDDVGKLDHSYHRWLFYTSPKIIFQLL